ncbi:MAG TPA: 3D domain-containing protein [Longimicrobiaceae bacterium]|nr:3D domain-containing protein [Longimicrobiaceae bacterium]
MSDSRLRMAPLLAAIAVSAWACGPRPVATPAPAAAQELGTAPVLAPAPEPDRTAAELAELRTALARAVEAATAAEARAFTAEARAAAAEERAAAAERSAGSGFPVSGTLEMSSTAYCLRGNMRTGVRTRDGMAAGDPRVLPLGSVVRLAHPDGRPIGIFVVMDTGGAIKGNKIDIYMADCGEAIRWGRRPVVAEVLAIGRV